MDKVGFSSFWEVGKGGGFLFGEFSPFIMLDILYKKGEGCCA